MRPGRVRSPRSPKNARTFYSIQPLERRLLLASIAGTVFNDLNGDLYRQPFEPPLAGNQVFIDSNGNGTFNTGEPVATADANGHYAFNSLAAGTYEVAPILTSGWRQSAPGERAINLSASSNVTQDWGMTQQCIVEGTTYVDADGSGTFDSGESVAGGWIAYDDLNNSSSLDPGEPNNTSSLNGTYQMSVPSGTVRIRVIAPPGYQVTAPASARWSGTLSPLAAFYNADFGAIPPTSVSGTVYNDYNASGANPGGGFGLGGARAYLDTNTDGSYETGEPTAISGYNGKYTISGVNAGNYTLTEIPPTGWYATSPGPPSRSVTLTRGRNLAAQDFGNFQFGVISGNVFNDLNGDTVQQSGESALSGWTVFLDTNGNGALDSGEATTTTGAGGAYSFSTLSPDQYKIGVVTQTGYVRVAPETTETVATSGTTATVNVAVTTSAVVTGTVFQDLNGNQAYEPALNEFGLGGWTVYADLDNSGGLGAGEPQTVSAAGGAFFLGGLASGTYTIREVPLGGTQSVPPSQSYSVAVTAPGTSGGYLFGNTSFTTFASVSGTIYGDLNGNGVIDPGEPQPGPQFTVWLDANNDGLLDNNEPSVSTNSTYSFTNLPAPATYAVRIKPNANIPGVWVQTLPSNNAGQLVSVLPSQVSTGVNFALRDLTANTTFAGNVFDDAAGNGTFNSTWDGKLPARTVYLDFNNSGQLDSNEPSVLTDSSGNFQFAMYTPGPFHVRQVIPTNWVQTLPAGGDGSILWPGGIGTAVTGASFAAARAVTITGSGFNDQNHDGAKQGAEPVLSGIIVYVDTNGNGVFDSGEPNTTTNGSGAYTFTNLPPGAHSIRQVVPGGWAQTAPTVITATVPVAEGESTVAPAFGHVLLSTVPMDSTYQATINSHLGQSGTFAIGDLNGDGIVNAADLLVLQENFGHAIGALLNGSSSPNSFTLIQDSDHSHIDWTLGASTGQILMSNVNGLTINGNGGADTLTLDYTNGNPLPAALHLNGTFTINGLAGSNPLANTTLDVGKSTVIITYADPGSDPLAAIKGYLKNGYNSGAWNGAPTSGTGVITSAAAQNAVNHNTAVGYADSADGTGYNSTPNSIELRYTLYGDVNLDGSVNFLDFSTLAANYNVSALFNWDQGGFDYAGSVNFTDFSLLAANYNTTLGSQAAPAALQAQAPASVAAEAPGRVGVMPTVHVKPTPARMDHHKVALRHPKKHRR